jgi:branched-chain amino acid transport system substrate-binding protein
MTRFERRAWASLCAGVLLLASGAGCDSAQDSGSDDSSSDGGQAAIKVALEAPLTGEQSSNGMDIYNGAKLAVDEANAEGGVLGRDLELIRADDRADPEVGMRVAEQMVAEGVFAVVGPFNSAVGVENLPTYVDAGVIPMHLVSNRAANRMGFTLEPQDFQVAPVETGAILEYFKAETVAIIYDSQTYTSGIAEEVRASLRAAGVDVVAYESLEPGARSYTDIVREVVSAEPGLLYVSTYFPEGGLVAKAIAQLKSPPTCLMGIGNPDPGFVEVSGLTDARLCSFSGPPPAEDYPGAGEYVDRYRASYDREPGTRGVITYDSVNLLIDAAERVGAWDADRIRDELARTADFDGVTGPVTIDPGTGSRVDVPLAILRVDADGHYTVDPRWAALTDFGG